MARTEILVSGFGGQGVIKSGYIIGKAASIYDDKNATLTQSFGPEARGSACSARVVVSDDRVLYPYIDKADILISMSQEAYTKFEPMLGEKGVMLIDEDLVKTTGEPRGEIKMYKISATRIAEQLGRKIVLNIVMLGFFTAITKLIKPEAARQAVKSSVPPGTIPLNMKAFEAGYEYGLKLLGEGAEAETTEKAEIS
jgi:2-oxoglutarate ferredoxin oxidoreductase subunit gamma